MSQHDAEVEVCRECGQSVLVMCMKWTGFCSHNCENEWIVSQLVADTLRPLMNRRAPWGKHRA